MNKKLLISLGTLSSVAVIAPIMATVSCSSETPLTVIENVKAKETAPTDLKITDLKEMKMETVATLFDGIDATNFKNMTTSYSKTDGAETFYVTLTAKKGYTFKGTTSIKSAAITLVKINLDITAMTAAATTITQAELDAKPITLETLKKAFEGNGLTADNFPMITTTSKDTTDKSKKVITITVGEGYVIGKDANATATTLDSTAFTVASAK